MDFLHPLNELIFPGRCISCKRLGDSLCFHCKSSWTPQTFFTTIPSKPKLLVVSTISYSDIAARIILAAKESHLKSADRLVAAAISHSLSHWLKSEWIDTLIPIPSRKVAVRKRGRQFIEEVAKIAATPIGIAVASPLHHARHVRDQSGLKFEQRWNNLDGAFVVKRKPAGLGRVLLVDDLVTTGATLNEAARALRYAGIEVMGAVTAVIAPTVR